jgi:hypothetical protein
VKLLLDYSDGRYTTRPLADDEAKQLEEQGFDVAHLEDRVYDAYLRHCEQDGVWQALWRSISNEMYIRRRERELLPLEQADREIARLKSDLARAERMASFFEDEWLRATGRQPASEHDRVDTSEFTCVFPQPGCDLDALESEEWRASASEILRKYDSTHAAEGLRHQGCCCGHTHKKLSPDKIVQLCSAGFLVENDAELLPEDP